jgi:hypothetical protein
MSDSNSMPARLAAFALAFGLAGTAEAGSLAPGIMGQAQPGDVVVISNIDTGFRREVEVKGDGRFKVRNLSSGIYEVVIRHPDGSSDKPIIAELHIGTMTRVN